VGSKIGFTKNICSTRGIIWNFE